MFWTLLIGICFFTAVGSAWDAAKPPGASVGTHVLVLVVGLVIGGACAWAMWRVCEAAGNRATKLQSETRQRWYIRGIYASSLIWILLAAVLARWATDELLKLLA